MGYAKFAGLALIVTLTLAYLSPVLLARNSSEASSISSENEIWEGPLLLWRNTKTVVDLGGSMLLTVCLKGTILE